MTELKDGDPAYVRGADGLVCLAIYRKTWSDEWWAYVGTQWTDKPGDVDVVRRLRLVKA